MNDRRLLKVGTVIAVATAIVAVVSLFVLRLPEPWNWFTPLVFLALTAVVGFMADILSIRDALRQRGVSRSSPDAKLTSTREAVPFTVKRQEVSFEKPTVFMSYSHTDSKFVDQLAGKLQASGVDVWIDKWMIKVGDSITQRINEGIGASDFLIVVLSGASVNSKWVRDELNAATIKNIEEEKRAFVLPNSY